MSDPTLPTLLAAALRRFLVLLVVVAGSTAVVSLLIGQLLGAGVSRSVSLGFYGVGSFLLIAGFFVGNRGPARVKGDPGFNVFGIFTNRQIRWAVGLRAVRVAEPLLRLHRRWAFS